MPHGVQRALDQVRAVIMRDQLHAGRQVAPVDALHFLPHMLQHFERVFAFAQDHDSLHHSSSSGWPGTSFADAPEAELFANRPRAPDR